MRIAWTLFAVAAFLIGLFSYLSYGWGTKPDNALTVSYFGLILAIVGLFASGVGFTIAIEQVRKTLSASKASELAINNIRSKLSTLSVNGDVEKAKLALEETERHIHDEVYKNVRHSLSPARQCLVRIHEIDMHIFSDLKGQIEAAAEEMGTMSDMNQLWNKDSAARNAKLIRSYIDLTNRMSIRINRG